MKAFAIILLLLVPSLVLYAQNIEEMSLPWKTGQKVKLELKFADSINVKAWAKKEVFLKAEVSINDGQLNHVHTMDSIITTNMIGIETGFDESLVGKSYWCDCDGKGSAQYNFRKGDRGKMICSTINYTVFVPSDADLELETISGNIVIINMKGEIDAESVSGNVDVMTPSNQRADVHLKSVMGRVASYPDIFMLEDGLKPMLARQLKGKLNGGGKEIYLESVTGDVSLRSKE